MAFEPVPGWTDGNEAAQAWMPPKTSRLEGFRDVIASAVGEVLRCAVSPVFFEVDERLKDLLAKGDALERLSRIFDFELFR